MRFDLTDLRLFVAVVEHGSITAGARVCHLALASASARITGMEQRLGVPLLDRDRHGVRPTAAGRTLLDHARALVAGSERMHDDLSAFAKGLRGHVRLLANTAALIELVPMTLGRFLADNPGIDVALEERTSVEIALMLAEGRGDFGIAADTADLAALDTRVLAADRLVAVLPPSHRLPGPCRFADLLDEAFVGLSSGALHDHLLAQAARLGRRMACRVRVASFDNVLALVAAGAGVAVVPETALKRRSDLRLAVRPLADAWAHRRLLACARSLSTLDPRSRLLLEAITAAARP